MRKEAAPVAQPLIDKLLKSIGDWAKRNPKTAIGVQTGLSIPAGYFLIGKPTAGVVEHYQKGKAEFGRSGDMYERGSYANTLNPISSVMKGTDKVPEWYVNLFPNTATGRSNAHLTFKAGAVGLLAAALVGGYRAVKHFNEMDDLEEADRPGKELASQLSTTFEGSMLPEKQKKSAAGRIGPDDIFSWRNFFGTAIPIGATLLAASVAADAVDNYYDARRNKALDKAIASKENAVKQLITARARMAKGMGSRKELGEATQDLGDKDVYVKDASLDKSAMFGLNDLLQHFGATTAAVILASALGSYAYTAASDEDNIKYKAYKKGLKEYAKNKSGITPITIAPTDSKKYFDYINGDKAEKKAPRELPAMDLDSLNRPISISI